MIMDIIQSLTNLQEYGFKGLDYEEALNMQFDMQAIKRDVKQLQAENAQLKGEEPIPESWWADSPKLAQRTMERVIAENTKLRKVLFTVGDEAFTAIEGSGLPEMQNYERWAEMARVALIIGGKNDTKNT